MKMSLQKLLSIMLALVLGLGMIPVTALANEAQQKDISAQATDAQRVMIAADVHVSADDAHTQQQLKKTLTYAKNNGVDMMIFNGDTVNVGDEADYAALDSVFTDVFGSPEQVNMKFIFNMGNHEFYPTSACAHEETDYAVQFGRFAAFASKWSDFTAEQGSIYLETVGGISYVVAAPSDQWTYMDGNQLVYCAALGGYHENDIALIDSLIAQATETNPGKPVYLLSHHPWGETYGGASYGMPESKVVTGMRAVMEKYPHLVNVTSHTHFSSLHERSLAQDKWTTINTGMHTYGKYVDIETDVNGAALDYVNIESRRYTSTDPEGKALHGSAHLVWDISYGEDSFTATVFNMATETGYSHLSYTIPYGITAANKSEKFAYELTDRTAPALTWGAEDALAVQLIKNGSAVSLQLAFNDTEQYYLAEGYRISVLNAATGETLKTVLWASRFWAAQDQKDSYEITVDGLSACSEYKVTVEAIDFYGNYSAAKLEATVQYSGSVQTETALLLQKCNGTNASCSARDYSNIYFGTTPFASNSETLTLVVKTDATSLKLRALSNVSGEWSGSGVTKNLEDLGDGWKTATWTLSEILSGNDVATMNGFKLEGLVDGTDILMKDILVGNQTDWVDEFKSHYHGVITKQQIEVKVEEEIVRGQAIKPSTSLTIELANTEELATLRFDYKVTSGTFNISLNPDWDNAFGYFAFNADGNVDPYDGVSVEDLEDGYKRVTFDLNALTKYSGNPAKTLSFLYIRGAWTDATGYIDNIQFAGEQAPVDPVDRGQAIAASKDLTIELGNTEILGSLSFDYKVTSGTFNISLNPDWDHYFGYFAFNADGNVDPYDGVTLETLEDGYTRVTFDLNALTKFSGSPSKALSFLYIRGGWTDAAGYIDNVQYTIAQAKEPVVELYQNGQLVGSYTDLASAIAAYESGILVLTQDVTEDITVNGDLYLDLNGKTLTGNVSGNGTLYGLDSANDTYDASLCGGIVGNVSCNVVSNFKNAETAKRYIAIADDNGYTFHRIYVGITKRSLAPSVTGVGYKAEFYADEAVLALVDSVGYDLWLEGGKTISRNANFKNELTLRVKNFDAKNYGETNLYATASITIGGEKIVSSDYSLTLRQVVETVNANFDGYTKEQKQAVQDMVNANLSAMENWEIANILAWGSVSATVEYTFSGAEADRAGYAQGTVTLSNAETGAYGFYWADENGKLAGYRALGTVNVTEGTPASLTIAENIAIPAQADRLVAAMEDSGEIVGSYLLEQKANTAQLVKKFAVISDVHTNYNQGQQYLLDALKQFQAEEMAYIVITGDIGESDSDYAKYVSSVEESGFTGLIFASIGNHDQTDTGRKNFKTYAIYDGATKTWVGIDNAPAYFANTYAGELDVAVTLAGENLAYYMVTIDENAYIFMDQELTSTGNTPSQDNFSEVQLDFVEKNLYTYSKTHNLFIVEHAPVEQLKIGDKFDPGYGGAIQMSVRYTNNQRFVDLLMEYTEAIWLSGHTHVQYDTGIMYVDKYYDQQENLTETPIAHAVHVSSLAQPRWYEGNSMKMPNDFSAASQGYVCYQYENDIVFEARSFKEYTPNSTGYDASLFANQTESAYSWMIPLEEVEHEQPVGLIDLAVAENGYVRKGSVSFADTNDGLQVTFAAADNRFEIKTGDQTKAVENGYYLRFQIKTDLTSLNLGGTDYAGGRKTNMTLDLSAAGDNYTLTDLGDGWILVQIPVSVLTHESILSNFAVRFYDTNAAGTFYLKEMYIAPMIEEEEGPAVDYAVAANGNVRQGSVSFTDTTDGLQVTFSETSNRFEIKTGDQTKAFAKGYDLEFKIKTDLTSFDLGGTDYAGGRKTYIPVNLSASGDGYTVTDLGNGWKHIKISMNTICHDDIVTNFAIRFYNTNAAGTFYVKELFIKSEDQQVLTGTFFETGKDLTLSVGTTEHLASLNFDYIITSGNNIVLALMPNWDSYYGYYAFNANGSVDGDQGVTTEYLDNGYTRVTFDMEALNKISGSPSNVLDFIYVRGAWTDAMGYIDNISYVVAEAPVIPDRGQAIAPGTDLTLELGNTAELATLSFDYKVTSGTFNISLNPDWDSAFGYFAFDANGNLDPYAGVTVEDLEDGYKRVTFDLNAITKCNGNPSKALSFLYIRGAWTDATGYIDNIQFTEGAPVVTAVDYAVAENGQKRAGNPSWEDTADGLKVTFAAGSDRFEIKCGNQTANAAGTLKFKIKTDLTKIDLGGCNYTGSRKTYVSVDLTTSGSNYTVTDLGDGWLLVEIPMSVIGYADLNGELAIRFYNTNAAGTFYLKDMNFVA